ncbi:MAG: gluconolaconase [Acidobacteriota bacterium]|nr:gluconolaconase [Acidobacteriota bacterium]MDH3528866.1 gluconolaconase [Acidobacteriota bacterium]
MTFKDSVPHAVPDLAIPGGEIEIHYEISDVSPADIQCLFDGLAGDISAASSNRLFVRVPEGLANRDVEVRLSADGVESEPLVIQVGARLCGEMHIVANPAIDPSDGSVILTRSGTRGQELPTTLFRIRNNEVEEISAVVMNPTGIAFDPNGRLLVTNRADGEVVQINDDDAVTLASELGVATGLAFDSSGTLYIGDRNGTIYKMSGLGDARDWARIEASVSAFHLAFGPDGDLYVAAPGLCSHDVIHRIDTDGNSDVFFKGLGRPQGLAFDAEGNLYVAACLRGRHGVVRIDKDGSEARLWIAGMSIVGLCFDSEGRVLVATSDSLFAFDVGVQGILV